MILRTRLNFYKESFLSNHRLGEDKILHFGGGLADWPARACNGHRPK